MIKVLEKEARTVFAGATYEATCPYCGMVFGTTYWPLLISEAVAKILCEGRLRNHIIEVHYDNL